MVRLRWLGLWIAGFGLSACGAGALFEDEASRQARLQSAVAEVVGQDRGWQTAFIEQRTATLVTEQRAATERVAEVETRIHGIEDRIDALVRSLPKQPAPGIQPVIAGPAVRSVPSDIDAAALADLRREVAQLKADLDGLGAAAADRDSLKRDLDAMTDAVAGLLAERQKEQAAQRARFERLEFRTRSLPWPQTGAERGVHLASYRSHRDAMTGWEILLARHRPVLAAEAPTFVDVETVSGPYVRLFVGVGEPARRMTALRDGMRAAGEYAMIMPLPQNPES